MNRVTFIASRAHEEPEYRHDLHAHCDHANSRRNPTRNALQRLKPKTFIGILLTHPSRPSVLRIVICRESNPSGGESRVAKSTESLSATKQRSSWVTLKLSEKGDKVRRCPLANGFLDARLTFANLLPRQALEE
jgi:hypothetical protein